MAVLGLCCCVGFSLVAVSSVALSCSMWTYCSGFTCCRTQALGHAGFSSCGTWTCSLLGGVWDLRRPGIEPVSPVLAGGFVTTEPPGKPQAKFF